MRDLIIEGNQQKPEIFFSASTGKLEISGQSLPEDAAGLYNPVIEWVKQYAKSPAIETILNFKMKYYNTASSKMFFNIVKELNNLYKIGINVEINWHYQQDDEDMLDAGEYFKDLVDVPFNFITY